MRFVFQRHDHLPRLAWCARMRRGHDEITVLHGPWVETRDDFFCEGAWDGDFEHGDLEKATAFLGSGARLRGDAVIFTLPTHVLERVYSIRFGDELVVANSLAFVLAQTADGVDATYKHYQSDLLSVMRGIGRGCQSIPSRDGRTIRLHTYANLRVGRDLSMTSIDRLPPPPPYSSYEDYVARTEKLLEAIDANARSASRMVRYEMLTTISSGYDSPACAVFARTLGCRTAVTFTHARDAFAGDEDSGAAIGNVLGLEVLEFDRATYRAIPGYPEAEFVASGTGGEEVVFAAMEERLRGSLLLTGYLGDTAWDIRHVKLFTDHRMAYPGGLSLSEFRLRVGFIHAPLPVFGLANRPSLQTISSSPAMRPWSTGTDYDRPIARRLVEERGVPREVFGQAKKAVTQPMVDFDRLDTVMTDASYRDLVEFARRTPEFAGLVDRLRFQALGALHQLNLRINWRIEALGRRAGLQIPTRLFVSERFRRRPGVHAVLFHWGIEKLLPRYQTPVDVAGAPAKPGPRSTPAMA
jgi:hypothetical protein